VAQYTLKVGGEEMVVDACDLEEALREAGIGEDEEYEVVEVDDFEDKCLLSAITDDILFGS
jgi:hypothetical protein